MTAALAAVTELGEIHPALALSIGGAIVAGLVIENIVKRNKDK